MNRLDLPDDFDGNTTELVTQTSKTENSIRMIPLVLALMQEFHQWRMVQAQDRSTAGEQYRNSNRLMADLYAMAPQRPQMIPVLMEMTMEGKFIFTCPVYMDLACAADNFTEGYQRIQMDIMKRLTENPYIPDVDSIVPGVNQTLLQIPA